MSIFPTKILLDTDSSQNAQLARTTAVDMATTTDSELHVVTVAPSLPPYDGYHCYDVRIPEVVEQLRQRAQIILDEQVQKIERDGGKVTQKHLTRIIHERSVGFYFARGKTDEHAENAAFSLHHLLERSKLAFPLFISETRLRE